MGKSNEQKKNEYLTDLVLLIENLNNHKHKIEENGLYKINRKGFYEIHTKYESYEELFKDDDYIKFTNPEKIELKVEKFEEELEKIKKERKQLFNLLKKIYELKEEYTSLINGKVCREILEIGTICYGMPKYKGPETEYRYVTEAAKDNSSKGHYEHVVPIGLFQLLFKNENLEFEEFDSLMKNKLFVCKVSDEENQNFKYKDKMPDENLSTETDVWKRYYKKNLEGQIEITVIDKYEGKNILIKGEKNDLI